MGGLQPHPSDNTAFFSCQDHCNHCDKYYEDGELKHLDPDNYNLTYCEGCLGKISEEKRRKMWEQALPPERVIRQRPIYLGSEKKDDDELSFNPATQCMHCLKKFEEGEETFPCEQLSLVVGKFCKDCRPS
jgi:hypothetical protein